MVDLVTRHTTCHLYRLTPGEVHEVCRRTQHPLGDIKKAEIAKVREVRDWEPTFAFTHLFHYYLEQRNELPTWERFSDFLLRSNEGRELFGDEIHQKRIEFSESACRAGRNDITEQLVGEALRWRVGLAYYSFLREVYSVVALRSLGVDVRVHPLADAMCRVDAWVDDTIISLWVSNAEFRTQAAGRKIKVGELLGDTFRYLDIELDKATTYGRVHLPSRQRLEEAARRIKAHA
ncbi:hypothetical protein ACFWQL_22500 [Amycolatopsis thermoflava]|uniref:hypothetical protein n=1 Tax=Amycolatopsis thermoflava TaxID=84480 RepID=UPI003669857B